MPQHLAVDPTLPLTVQRFLALAGGSAEQARDLLDDLTADDRAAFSFDLSKVDWRDYVTRRHIPGLLRLGGFDSTRS